MLLWIYSQVGVGPGRKPRMLFSHAMAHIYIQSHLAASRENRFFAYAKTKAQIRFAVTAKLVRAFVFATQKVPCADPEGGDRGSGPPLEFEKFT